MIRNDYIMRLIELLGVFIARVSGKIETLDLLGATTEIEQLSKETIGLPLAVLENNPPDALEDLLSGPRDKDYLKILSAATILELRGDIGYRKGNEIEGHQFWIRATYLFATAAGSPDREIEKRSCRSIDRLWLRIRELNVPRHLHHRLAAHYESKGAFDLAENHLYDSFEDDDPDLKTESIAFFERLLTLSDEKLEAGGLPRDEVLETLSEMGGES